MVVDRDEQRGEEDAGDLAAEVELGSSGRGPDPLEHAVGALEGDRGREVAVGDDDDAEGEDAGNEQGEDVDVVASGDGVVGTGRAEDEQDPERHGEGEERRLGVAPERPLVEPDLVEDQPAAGHQLMPSAVPTSSRYTLSRLGWTSSRRGTAPTWRASSGRRHRTRADAAVLEDGDPVGQVLGLVEVVGREDDGRAQRPEVVDDRPAPSAGLGVEAGGGLVEEDQLGVAGQRQREVEPAALPTGEPAYDGVAARR